MRASIDRWPGIDVHVVLGLLCGATVAVGIFAGRSFSSSASDVWPYMCIMEAVDRTKDEGRLEGHANQVEKIKFSAYISYFWVSREVFDAVAPPRPAEMAANWCVPDAMDAISVPSFAGHRRFHRPRYFSRRLASGLTPILADASSAAPATNACAM